MRAALVDAWPALSETFGIYPWDVPRLAVAELRSYLDVLQARAEAAERQAAEANRRR